MNHSKTRLRHHGIEKQKLHTVGFSDTDLLLQCIDGAESEDSDSDCDGYIDEEEALTDLLQRRLASDSFILESNYSAPPSPTGKMILHTYKIRIIVVYPLVATSTSTIGTASPPTRKTRQYQ